MAFTVSSIAAKDSAGSAIGGGLLAGDVAGSGVGPFFLFHGIVDGAAGVNKATVKAASTAAVASDPALVVALSPNGLNANGKTTASLSAPSVLASDGFIAHDAVDAENPIKIGGYASAAAPTNVSGDADRVQAWFLRNGAQAINITAAGALIPGDATTGLAVGGAIAHDAADTGNPSKIGFKATTSLAGLTLVSDADRTNGFAGVDGVQIVRPDCNLEDIVTGMATITDGSSTSVIASAGAGVKIYITDVVISNSSATAAEVDLRDGAAGSVKCTFPAPANKSGVVKSFKTPLPFSAATAVCADPDASLTSIKVTLIGFKSKV